MLADASLAVVHDSGKLGEEPAPFGIAGFGNLSRPRGGWERYEIVAAADAKVDDGGGVIGANQVPFGDGPGEGCPPTGSARQP